MSTETATREAPEVDEARLGEFIGGFATDLGAVCHAATVLVGDRLGLYRAMSDCKPVTADELARRTGCDERHLAEWFSAQAAESTGVSTIPICSVNRQVLQTQLHRQPGRFLAAGTPRSGAEARGGRPGRRRRLRIRGVHDPHGTSVPGIDVRRFRQPRTLGRGRQRCGFGAGVAPRCHLKVAGAEHFPGLSAVAPTARVPAMVMPS